MQCHLLALLQVVAEVWMEVVTFSEKKSKRQNKLIHNLTKQTIRALKKLFLYAILPQYRLVCLK